MAMHMIAVVFILPDVECSAQVLVAFTLLIIHAARGRVVLAARANILGGDLHSPCLSPPPRLLSGMQRMVSVCARVRKSFVPRQRDRPPLWSKVVSLLIYIANVLVH